jgi:hypothetical protein
MYRHNTFECPTLNAQMSKLYFSAHHGHWSPRQVDQQPRHARQASQRVCPIRLSLHSPPRLRARGRKDHNLKEAKPHPQRRRVHRRLLL